MAERRDLGRPVLMAALGAYVVLCAAVIAIRWDYLARLGEMFKVTGAEGPSAYTVWKARHGYQVYEWPQRDNFSPTLYNFLFYEAYGKALRALGVSDESLLAACRAITASLALVGAAVTWRLVRRLASAEAVRGPIGWLVAAYVAALWLGPGTTVWWSVSVRPDVAAVVFALAGLLCMLHALDRGAVGWAVAASACFFVDWAFKQSAVWTLAGAACYLLLYRRWKLLGGLTVPFAAATAIALWVGGPEYRYNLLTLPRVSPFRLHTLLLSLEVLLPNLFVYAFAVVALFRGWADPARRLVACCFLLTTVFGLFALSREGASRNMLFESLFLAVALSTAELARLLAERPMHFGFTAASVVLMISMSVYPAANLFAPRIRAGLIRTNLTFGSTAEYTRRRAMAGWMAGLPMPIIFPRDEILSQPWFATAGRYPAFVMDSLLYAQMESADVLEDGGIVGKIRRRRFGAVLDRPDGEYARAAAEAGYQELIPPAELQTLPGDSLGEWPVSAWVRPQTAHGE